MVTVAEVIETLVKQKPFVEGALLEGLLNLSAFSRQIKPDVERILKKPVTEASILMALKRKVDLMDVTVSRKIENATREFGDIIVRSNLTDFTFRNSDALIEKQRTLIKLILGEKDVFYTISRGVFETTIVVSRHFTENVKQIFSEEKLIASTHSVSSITIRLPDDNINIPGLYYFVFKQIAWEGISILEVISTTNELTIILQDKDVDRAFSILKRTNI
ncbi:MAG TPA: aspartate kinase [Bacteroidales bacterium]|nr:aspartate kinase [Bacteroidales bacterium]